MRNCLLVLIAGVMLCVPLGCNQGGDEEPATYERDVDGPPVALYSSMPDYEIIGDPAEVARRRQLFQEGVEDTDQGDVGSGDLTGPEGDASEDEIAEVKDVIAQIMATADAGDETVALALFDENAGAAVQSLTGGLEALQAKALALDSLMQTKFDQQYPDTVKAKIGAIPEATECPKTAAELIDGASPEQLVFTKIGEKIVVTTPQKRKFVFAKSDIEWKVGFEKSTTELVGVYTEILTASTKLIDDTTAGLDDGTITADNVEIKITEFDEQFVAPAKQKLAAIQAAATGAGAEPVDDGAGAPVDDTTPPAGAGDTTITPAPADDATAPAGDATTPAAGAAEAKDDSTITLPDTGVEF